MSKRVAFASIDGSFIDQHFGSARYFQVFDIVGTEYDWVEARRTEPSCHGNCDGGFEELYKTLNDCDAIFVLKIGQGAAAYMIGRGKRVFEASGPVDGIMEQLIQENLLD